MKNFQVFQYCDKVKVSNHLTSPKYLTLLTTSLHLLPHYHYLTPTTTSYHAMHLL